MLIVYEQIWVFFNVQILLDFHTLKSKLFMYLQLHVGQMWGCVGGSTSGGNWDMANPTTMTWLRMEVAYTFYIVTKTFFLRKVVRNERVNHLDLSSPICCWHKLVESHYLVYGDNWKLLHLRRWISFQGVHFCRSFFLFALLLNIQTPTLKSSKVKSWCVWDLWWRC